MKYLVLLCLTILQCTINVSDVDYPGILQPQDLIGTWECINRTETELIPGYVVVKYDTITVQIAYKDTSYLSDQDTLTYKQTYGGRTDWGYLCNLQENYADTLVYAMTLYLEYTTIYDAYFFKKETDTLRLNFGPNKYALY